MKLIAPLPVLLAGLALSGCMSTSSLTSLQPERPVIPDGDLVEWVDSMHDYEDGRLRVGVQNDSKNVYLAISSSNRTLIQQIMAGGLTVWLNAGGDKSKEVGIKYPLGIRDVREPGTGRAGQADGEEARNDLLDQTISFYELIFEEGKPLRRPVGSDGQVKLGASYDYGVFAVEMVLPFSEASGAELHVASIDGLTFGLGIQTPDLAGMRGGANPQGGGGGGARGGTGGRRGGGQGGGAIPVFPPIDLWITVSVNR
ncbi:hypothetical protein HQ496_02145 [bacterium]|nr:hypothetical protein [bacterium]